MRLRNLIFRQHNVIEYKSPGDSLNIDDFYKTLAYAFLYKSLSDKVDGIPADQLTWSLVRQGYPRDMIKKLQTEGMQVFQKYLGIYYIEGALIPAQIVVTQELDTENHRSLRVLTNDLSEADAIGFLAEASSLTSKGDMLNISSVLTVSMNANYTVYEDLQRREIAMDCEPLKRLMKGELDKAEARGEARGKAIGEARVENIIVSLLKANQKVEFVAKVVKMTKEQVIAIGKKAAVLWKQTKGAGTSANVAAEYPVDDMEGHIGQQGFVDYVLFGRDGLPLAGVEAKRSSKDPKMG